MTPDAALYARLVSTREEPPVPFPPDMDLPLLAARLASGVRDVSEVLREAADLMAELREGRRGVAERLAATIARAETVAEVQAIRMRDLLRHVLRPA
ncbi:hypothetical protein [Sabulicella glaciei]|uniref:Uncharacterized protein n=1 Tax=Sabulicella glaciei TaxID=2984948 RepID=A0ABT3NR11_9PROT|nr:hypothetical protein [Roseococcus sp. MDT2-1-1]MCW8084596.1 hypothetical protein [Roseococcus sp. MDT2-1-1]